MLEEERKKIDRLDAALVELLEERMDAVTKIAEIKKEMSISIMDESREKEVLDKVAQKVKTPTYQPIIVETFQEIMRISRQYQGNQ